MKENKSAFFQQKYPEILPFANGAGTDFDRYDWAFNSEDTDPEILSQCKATLDNPDSSDDEKQTASFVVSRDGLKKNLRTEYKIGQISKAVDEGNENAELLGWLDLLGCTEPDESIEDSCRIHCGGKTPKEALQYFRDNFKGHIENGDTEAEKFSALSPEQKRKFIGGLHESELSEDTAKVDNMGLPIAGRSRGKTREMTNEQFDKWSKEYLDGTKYNKFRNMIFHSGERNVRLGLALSMTQDADSQKAFIPALQSLSQEDRDEIYYVAHEFNPEVDMWNLVKDDFIQSWADIPQALKNGYDWIKTTPADLKQYVDSHGGLDKIMSDEKTKDEFRNKYFTATGAFLGFNRFALPAGGGDTALRDYASRVYDMGKGALELRARYDEIQNAMAAKYDSKGYVADHIIQGVSFGIQFGQFAVASVVSGGTASLMGALAKGAGAISKADKVLKAGKAVSLAATAQKLATAAKYADKGAYYGRWANKLVIPYFGAMMSVDAQNAAQKAGFTDDQSFVLGAGIGVVNSFLEKIQFGIRSKNIFLGEKVVRAIENHKDILKTVTMQYCIDGIKNRGKHFGEEYFVENLQNVVQEVGLALGGTLSGNDYKDAMSIVNDLFIQAKDMIIPLFTATNIGAGTSFGKSLRTFAQAESFGKDVAALHSFNAAIQTNEVLAKMQEAELPALTPQVAQRYFNASTEEERAFVLFRSGMNQKERGKAKKVLSDMEGNLQKRGEALVNAVKNRVESSPEVLLLDDKSAPDHEKNAAYIADFAKAYGIEDEIVYLPTLKDAPAEIIEAARRELANKEYSAADIQELLFGGKGADGFRNGGKIYIVGDKALTPQRTLEILKHESGHRGAEGIRSQKEFKTFLDNLITENGGEEIVREGIRRAKGNVYEKISEERLKAETEKRVKKISESNADTLAKEYGLKVDGLSFAEKLSRLKDSIRKEVIDEDKYTLGEEFMCMLAEKVAGKNELTDAELSTWAKVKDFFVELLSGIPQNEKARDIYIANMIRSIWGREYLEDIPDGDFFDMSDEATDEAGSESMKKEQTIPEELAKKRAATAKKNFLSKIQKRRVFEKKLTAEERETEQRKAEIQEYLDSIPDDDISNKLEAISTVEDEDLLSDEILQYAAENGEKWAEDALEMRLNEREKAEIDKEGDSLLDVMRSGGYKLPTPKAIITDCKQKGLPLSGTLFGEINDLYNSLNFYQQQKYFSPRYVDIDDLANTLAADHNFPYEGSSDFLSDFAENVWGQKETRFSFAGNKDDSRSPEELDALNKKFKDLYDKYKNGNVEITPETRNFEAKCMYGQDGDLIKSADMPFKIYDIDEAYKFARENLQGKQFRSKDNHLALLSRNALDKMNSGKSRGKTDNNRLHALALANTGRLFSNSELLEAEKPRNGVPDIKNYLKFYAPLYMDGQLYAVKITAKELKDDSEKKFYSIEGIDINREPDQSGLSEKNDNQNSSTAILVSGSVNKFIGRLREVNRKIDDNARETTKIESYKEAVELVAKEAKRKGYTVEVYHGTGADGFNVAKADSSEAQNGEGNQAHGMGLYMAVFRDTAEGYKNRATNHSRNLFSGDRKLDATSTTFGFPSGLAFELTVGELRKYGISDARKLYKNNIKTAKAVLDDYLNKRDNAKSDEDRQRLGDIVNRKSIEVEQAKAILRATEALYSYLRENSISPKTINIGTSGGHVFDWLHNMKPEELLDEDKSFSEQNPEVQKKLRQLSSDFSEFKKFAKIIEYNRNGGWILKTLEEEVRDADEEYMYKKGFPTFWRTANKILLDYKIRGITYDGRQDGRRYVSFEGGATVKLQDPFTFDDNGELIPLSERFNNKNPDMRFSFGDLRDIEEQIKTPEFKAWFGDSEVVDENGKPLHVYHGTGNTNDDHSRFTIFGDKNSKWARRVNYHFFSSNPDVAGSMGDYVYDVFLRIENPLVIDAGGNEFGAIKDHTDGKVRYENLTTEQKKKLCSAFELTPKELAEAYKGKEIDLVQAGVISRPEKSSDEWARFAKENGYDGVIFKNLKDGASYDSMQNPSDVYVAFEPTQIKDATKNIGTFDGSNPDIRFSFATLEKLKNAKPVEVGINDYKGHYELTPKSARNFIQKELRRKKYTISDTGEDVEISQTGEKKITSHDRYNEDYLRSFIKIPQMIESGIFLGEETNIKGNNKYDKYRYYACGLKIGDTDYTARLTIGERNGKWFYDQALTQIEKGDLIERVCKQTSLFSAQGSPNIFIDKRLLSLLQQNKSDKVNFSFANNPIHQKKRELSVKLAHDMYKRLGDKFDVTNPEARRDVQPTEEERQDVYMSDMGLLDEDVDDVCNRATAILWKLVNSSPKRSLKADFDRMAIDAEKSFEYSHIVEACIKDAIKGFKEDLDISKRVKEQEQRDAKAEMNGVKGFNADELAVNGIDLMEAVCDFLETEDGELLPNESRIDEQIDAIINFCKDWADSNSASYEIALGKIRATLVENFNYISDKTTYGEYIKSACKAILALSKSKSEESLKKLAGTLARKFAKFIADETRDFVNVKVDDAIEESLNQKEQAEKKAEREAKQAEKDAKRKAKEAEEKAESKLKKLHRKAVKMFEVFADGQKLPDNNKLEIKRKLPARVQAYLAQIKKVVKLDEKKIKERYEYLSKRKSDLNAEGEEPNYKERYEMSALMIFGNIREKSLPEILNAYAELKKLIEGERDAQVKRLEEWEAQISEKAQPLCNALSLAGNKESKSDGVVYAGAKKNISMFEHRLRNLFLARKGLSEARYAEIEAWIVDYSKRVGRASIFERNLANSEMAWLQDELTNHYGDAQTGFERLTKVNPEWSKFASDAGRDMSLGQIMQILCTLEQWQVKEAWERAQKKMGKLAGNPEAEIDEKFERAYRYWEKMFAQKDAMNALLNDADKALIQSLKQRYGERLDVINPIYERLNGLPMISNGSNYMPIVRLGEFDIDQGGGNVISLFPSYYTPRTISLKALDENVNILQVFSRRTETDAHFIHFADLIFETKELLRNGDLASLIRTNLTKEEQQGFADTIRDVFNGKIRRDNTVDGRVASILANFTAYFGLAFNVNSAMKQPTSAPAFLLKVPAKDYFGGLKELLVSGELFSSVCEVWNSPFMKDRRNNGDINQILADFMRVEKQCKNEMKAKRMLRRFWAKYAFMPTKYADNFAFILGGTSVYYHFLKQYRELYPEAEAKRLAMADMVNIGEMTQQSAFIMNMSEGQRQGAGFGRMFSTFRTTNQQYLSFELNAYAEVAAHPSGANFAKLAKVVLLNHAILPAMFNGAGLLLNLAMGDDWDDDDLDYLMKSTAISCVLDVYTGWWFGAILKGMSEFCILGGNKRLTDSMLPASSVARLAESILNAAKDVYKNGFSDAEWFKHFDKIGKSVFSPYRLGRKIYDNATEN